MRAKHKTIVPGGLLQACWLIANAEAKNLGAAEILPIHFLLAVMKIIDPAFPEQLDALKISSDEWAAMCEEAQNIRRYIDVVPERVTNKRRGLRKSLAAKRVNPPITADGLLHRSADVSRRLGNSMAMPLRFRSRGTARSSRFGNETSISRFAALRRPPCFDIITPERRN